MEDLKKEFAEAMREELHDTVNSVDAESCGRLTANTAKVETKTAPEHPGDR